jgi:hypothetical protein
MDIRIRCGVERKFVESLGFDVGLRVEDYLL